MKNERITDAPIMMLVSGVVLMVLFLLQPAAVKAQWTTPDANQNINNTNTGNVGVGTTTPNYKLDVTNAVDKTQIRFGLGAGDSGGFLYSNGPSYAALSGGASVNSGWFARSLSASIIEANLGQLTFYANSGLSTGSAFTPTARMRITSGGLVGIGTTSPTTKLHVVSGTDSGTALLSLDTGVHGGTSMAVFGTSNNESGFDMSVYRGGVYTSRFGVNNFGQVYLQPGGDSNVGIGTTSPVYSLDVNGGVNSFRAKASTALSTDTIATFENSSAIKMIVRANGNVGIGTTSPAKALDVTGDINASGTIEGGNVKAKYQDLAEWVESSQELSAGTVVVLDPSKSNHVVAGTQAYDSRVAGVISLKPGITLGEEGEGRVLVATTGRVKVKVDASNGPIQIGDLLVTSNRAGFAMKSLPVEIGGARIHRPGTLIGKALEPLAQGMGEILVLLSLQ